MLLTVLTAIITLLLFIQSITLFLDTVSSKRDRYRIEVATLFFCLAFWGLTSVINSLGINFGITLISTRLSYVSTLWAAYFLYRFIDMLDYKKNRYSLFVMLADSLASVFLVFTPYVVSEIKFSAEVGSTPVLGNMFFIYILAILMHLLLSAYLLIKIYKKLGAKEILRLKYLFLGLSISIAILVFTNLLLPLLGYDFLVPYGIISILPTVVLSTYSLKYDIVLDFNYVLGTLTKVLVQALVLLGVYVLITWGLMKIWNENIFSLPAYITGFFIAIVFLIGESKIKEIIDQVIKTKIMYSRFSPEEFEAKFVKSLENKFELEGVLNVLKDGLKLVYKPDFVTIFLKNIHTDNIEKIDLKGEPEITIGEIKGLKFVDDVYIPNDDGKFKDISLIGKTQEGYLVIGHLNSKFVPTVDNVKMFKSVLNKISVPIYRAQMYGELNSFNQTLQQKVNEQTKELQVKIVELEEARRKENDMIDIMGHELRTPATIVKLNASFLNKFVEEIKSDPNSYRKYVKRIQDAVENEIKLINTLLSSAKLEGDKIEINAEEIDILEEIEMSINGNEKDAQDKGLTIINDTDARTPNVYADKARIVEILNNLLSNAIKYTDKGGVKVSSKFDKDFVKISVTDTGRGIPKKDISKLGQKFYRVSTYIDSQDSDDTDIVRPGGTGLGLYVVFNLVKKMDGKITVESEVGKGTTFSFTLPRFRNQSLKKGKLSSVDMFERLGLKK